MEERIGIMYPVNLISLPGGQPFMFRQTYNAFHQTLSSQYFMYTRNASPELVGRIKEGGIGISYLYIQSEPVLVDKICPFLILLYVIEYFDGSFGPHGPVTKQSAHNVLFNNLAVDFKPVGCKEVVIILSSFPV